MIDDQILLKKRLREKILNNIHNNFISRLKLNEEFGEFHQGDTLNEIFDKIFRNEKYN